MGQQMRVPEGWKVEIRVRKSGRKDRYYVDPANGYIFRSLKDIDRYLLTGKLGRHVTKTKPKDCSDVKSDVNPPPDVPKEKDMLKPYQITKVELPVDGKKSKAARGQKLEDKASKREDARAQDVEEISKKKKKSCTSPSKGRSRSSREKDNTPFFILDPDQCEEGNAVDIPNLTEIIDSMQKEKEGGNTVYLSAAAIGSLLGAPLPESWSEPDISKMPPFVLTLYENCQKPDFPGIAPKFNVKRDDYNSKNIVTSYQDPPCPEKRSRTFDTKSEEGKTDSISPGFGNLLTDPCIDFAIKTLTGTMPLGSEPDLEDCCLQQQPGSSTITRDNSPCQN